ncbi:peptide-methionine (R)-S-oxide reductase MsrB [Craterilacuibacter sp.]|uniref:peptide-methionine (R)-S-oxide reductase MsrB n=1 Tax=Craterilacuibacter sp. TaxID=2870909 RepID=UPI003F2C724E
MDKIIKTPAQWRGLLDAETYRVTREAGTERPFSGALYPENRHGTYHCACCDAVLFASATKFDAHCGWPSFWQEAVEGSIARIRDASHGMERIEVRCARCDAHLGHVFPDGPPPTGERYCINSVSMRFAPAD